MHYDRYDIVSLKKYCGYTICISAQINHLTNNFQYTAHIIDPRNLPTLFYFYADLKQVAEDQAKIFIDQLIQGIIPF